MDDKIMTKTLWQAHETFKFKALNYFSPYPKYQKALQDIHQALFKVQDIGLSHRKKKIYKFIWGQGKKKVFLWSRMHGNEPTGSLAFLDIINFFKQSTQVLCQEILQKLQIIWIPVVNPDGASDFSRYNAQNIDINRDFLHLQSPEARILKNEIIKDNPSYCFNLHDQHFAWGVNHKPATIALLAPVYNASKSINKQRERAMELCGYFYHGLSTFLPNQIGRYKDDFEPRAFGDGLQKSGFCTILVESGGHFNDWQRDTARKANFAGILSTLYHIALEDVQTNTLSTYSTIPEIAKNFLFITLLHTRLKDSYGQWTTDIGINYKEKFSSKSQKIERQYFIEEMGDLSSANTYLPIKYDDIKVSFSDKVPALNDNVEIVMKDNQPIAIIF